MTDPAPPRELRALVLFSSRYGNTDRIAHAFARGLQRSGGFAVECRPIDEVPGSGIGQYDFLAFGAPTEIFSAPKSVKEYLAALTTRDLRGRRGFAFDTRLAGPLSGSAGRFIEKQLERLGVDVVRPHVSAIVRGMSKGERTVHGEDGAPKWARRREGSKNASLSKPPEPARLDLLTAGSEDAFEHLGSEIGAQLIGRGGGSPGTLPPR